MDLFDVASFTIKNKLTFEARFADQNFDLGKLVNQTIEMAVPGDAFFLEVPNGTRAVVVVTAVGNVIVHETDRDSPFTTTHAPDILRAISGRGKADDERTADLIGLWGRKNIGETINGILGAASLNNMYRKVGAQ